MVQSAVSVNPHATLPVSMTALAASLWRNRQLIGKMVHRQVVGRYRGSAFGLAWSFLHPILMLVVYTLVFSEVFKMRWVGVGADESKTQFALVLFVGLIFLNFFSEVLNRAPLLILDNVNYVKKVVFPLEVLPIVSVGVALFHSIVSLVVLFVVFLIFNGFIHWTLVFVPFVLLPLVILAAGLAWILASLGVFIRDVGQFVSIATTVLMFVSPVFYPVDAVPERFRLVIQANPLTFIIEQARAVIMWGHLPDWKGLLVYTVISVLFAWLGFFWFQKTRAGFADVL